MSTLYKRARQPIPLQQRQVNGRSCISHDDAYSTPHAALHALGHGPWAGQKIICLTRLGNDSQACSAETPLRFDNVQTRPDIYERPTHPMSHIRSTNGTSAVRPRTVTFVSQSWYSPGLLDPRTSIAYQVAVSSEVTLQDMPIDTKRILAIPNHKRFTTKSVLAAMTKRNSGVCERASVVTTVLPYRLSYTDGSSEQTRDAFVNTSFNLVPFDNRNRRGPTWREALLNEVNRKGTNFKRPAASSDQYGTCSTVLQVQRTPEWRKYGDSQPCTVSVAPSSDATCDVSVGLAGRLLLSEDPDLDEPIHAEKAARSFSCHSSISDDALLLPIGLGVPTIESGTVCT